jgi:hypothetical protein
MVGEPGSHNAWLQASGLLMAKIANLFDKDRQE